MLIRIITLIGFSFLLVACAPRPCKVPPVNQFQICQEIKRELIFINTNDPTLYPFQTRAANWTSPTRQALLLRKYREFNCDAVLGECVPPAVHRLGITPAPDSCRR